MLRILISWGAEIVLQLKVMRFLMPPELLDQIDLNEAVDLVFYSLTQSRSEYPAQRGRRVEDAIREAVDNPPQDHVVWIRTSSGLLKTAAIREHYSALFGAKARNP